MEVGDLRIRPAKHEDFPKIMDINKKVYDGGDYLPSNYHDFVRDPDVFLFVGEVESIVICFMGYVMNGDTEMVKIGLRVHALYEGKGHMSQFQELTKKCMMKKFPNLQRVSSCFKVTPAYPDEKTTRKPGFKTIDTFQCCWWRFKPLDLAQLYQDHLHILKAQPVHELNIDQAMDLIPREENLQRLFPTGYLIGYYNWLPKKLTHRNIRKFVMTHRIVVTMETETKIGALSFIAPNLLPAGNMYSINYYHDHHDAETFVSHLISHAGFAVRTTSEESHVIIHPRIQEDVDLRAALDVCRPYSYASDKSDFSPETGVHISLLMSQE